MFDGGTNCGKGDQLWQPYMVRGDHWWRRVWSGRTTSNMDNLRYDRAQNGWYFGGTDYGSHTWSWGTIGGTLFGLAGPLATRKTNGVTGHKMVGISKCELFQHLAENCIRFQNHKILLLISDFKEDFCIISNVHDF